MRSTIHSPMRIIRQRRSSLFFHGSLTPRKLIFYGVLCLSLQTRAWAIPAPPIPFSHHDTASLHKVIEGLEQDWRRALLSSNLSAIDRLLADDYLGVTANGTLETKADLMAMRRSGTIRLSQFDLSDLKVRVYGDTAVVTSKAEVAGTNGGTDITGRYRYTRVYNRRNGEWRIVSFEASRITETGRRR